VVIRRARNIDHTARIWRPQPPGLAVGSCDDVCIESAAGLYRRLLALLAFAYPFCAIGLQGVPGLSRSALLCAICLWAILLEGIRTRKIILNGWLLHPLAFCGYVVLTALRAPVFPTETLGAVVSAWAGAVGVGVALRNGVSWRVPVFAVLLAGLASIIAYHAGFDSIVYSVNYRPSASLQRATGLMGNANDLAISLGLPAFLVFVAQGQFSVVIRSFSLFLAVYGAIISGSRTGLALAVCLVSYVLLSSALWTRRFRYVYLVGIGSAVLVATPMVVNMLPAIADDLLVVKRLLIAFEGGGNSTASRLELMHEGYELFWQHPLAGHGLDMFRHLSALGAYAHNNFCELAVNGGALAIILFYSLHYAILAYSRVLPSVERKWFGVTIAYVLLQDMAVVAFKDKMVVLLLMMLLARAAPSEGEMPRAMGWNRDTGLPD